MPLPLPSLSHGAVAFGFFHIESDMLLLQRLFFFAGDLCALWQRLAAWPPDQDFAERLPGFAIQRPEQVGDLHGAIAGSDLGGFLGALYARWPFPQEPREFAQKPAGAAGRQVVEAEMARFGQAGEIAVTARPGPRLFSLGEYVFDRPGLLGLVDYVWRGGLPGWQEGRRPGYLERTAQALADSGSPWFRGQDWDKRRVGFGRLNSWRR